MSKKSEIKMRLLLKGLHLDHQVRRSNPYSTQQLVGRGQWKIVQIPGGIMYDIKGRQDKSIVVTAPDDADTYDVFSYTKHVEQKHTQMSLGAVELYLYEHL
jgi:hypothetical protein